MIQSRNKTGSGGPKTDAADRDPKISVIVSVYNTGAYLSRCVDSILAQSMRQTEIILVDDGSTDGSGAMCDDYAVQDERVTVIHQDNKGLSSARNTGIKESRGEYIMFVDSDDKVAPGFCEIPYRMALETGADMVMFGFRSLREDKRSKCINHELPVTGHVSRHEAMDIIHKECGCAVWSKLYRRDLFDDIVFPEGRLHEDIGTTYKLVHKAEKICCISNILYNYYTGRPSGITGSSSSKRAEDWYALWSQKSRDLKEWGYDVSEYELRNALGFIAKWGRVEGVTEELARFIEDSKGFPASFSPGQKAALALYRLSPALFDFICRIFVRHE